jgi:SAM-dependent methyltransferase
VLSERPRAPLVTPFSPPVSEARLTRRQAADLTRISVLLTVRNCREKLAAQLGRWMRACQGRVAEFIVVDDASTDGTWDVLAQCAAWDTRIRPLQLRTRRGAGEALRRAIRHSRGDVAIVASLVDASEHLRLDDWLAPIQSGKADAVVGTPMAVRADILRHLRLTSRGDEIGGELICRLHQWGAKVRHASRSESKRRSPFARLRDAWRTLRCKCWDTQFTTHAGFYILTAVAKADQYNRWIVDQVRPYLGRRVLEAGAGIGNLSPLFEDCDRLVLADREEVYLDRLEERFERDPRVRVMSVDLTEPEDVAACGDEKIDTIFCSNVLEHLEPDEQVLRSFADALQPGGHCVIVVPAGEKLYTGIDAALGHFRRYEPNGLAEKIRDAGMEVVFIKRFSRLGTLGWAVSGHVLRRRTLSPRQMIWFDRLLPLAKLMEYVLPVPGMSLIMVGRKPLARAQTHRAAA